MADQPFLPFFVGDFLGATVLWEGEERALYMLMLAYQWSGGALPADLEKLSRALSYPHKKFMSLWQTVGIKFDVHGSTLLNERLELHREKTVELSAARANAGSVGGKASAAKRAAQAGSKDGAKAAPKPLAKVQPNDQAIVEATVQATVQANGAARGIQKPTILSDPIHPIPIHPDPCVNPEPLSAHDAGDGNQGEPPGEADASPPGDDEGAPRASAPIPVVIDSFPYEQAIMADFPDGPNPPTWSAAMHNAHQLVSNGLATWPELVAAVRRYAAYITSGSATVNVAAHNFFDSRKGNYWQQDWKATASKSEKRLEGNLAAAAEAKRQLFGSTG